MIGTSDGATARSTAIVLFTDLVGSTELRSRLGDEATEEVRRKHDRLLSDAVERNRGRLVKNLGDGVMATFTGATDAVTTAVVIQQTIDRHNRSGPSGPALEVRIGLSAGDVVVEHDDCFGTPVIEAARLCGAANGGQILASEIVRWLAGSGGGHHFTPVGTLSLKGLPGPLPTCEVAWEPLLAELPMPTLLTDIGRIFVGREAEMERLTQLWKEAASGRKRVALLAGEPGVGKTRLAAEIAEAAHSEGATVLAGRCDEDLGVPYQPFVEALRLYVDHTPPAQRRDGLGRYGGELARLIPDLAEQVPGLAPPLQSDPETERYRLFDAVAAWLRAASIEAPLLLVLDDLQWAAKPTLLLLRHVVGSTAPNRLFILGTYRDTELRPDHPLLELLADLRRQNTVERLSLVGLDVGGVAAYMERAAGHALDDEDLALARAIHEETEGNPFFVREVLRHLTETGAVAQRAGRWGTRFPVEDLGIPEGVREVVGRRLSRLSPAANHLLEVGAVAGLEFAVRVVQSVDGLDDDALVASFEEAARARLVIEVAGAAGRYRFAHALVRDTIYSGLSTARRVTLHRRLAEAIERLHGSNLDEHLPALAHHWARSAAPAAETARAVDYAARAGDLALAQLANDEAASYYRQALELLDVVGSTADDRRLELLIVLGEAQRRAGDPACRATLLDAGRLAHRRGDGDAMARAALANSRGTFSELGVVDEQRVEALEGALGASGDNDPARRARLLATLAVELLWSAEPARCLALSDEALALARRYRDPRILGSVIAMRWATLWHPRWTVERLRLSEELLSLAEITGDPSLKFWGQWRRALAYMELCDVSAADEWREAAGRQADDLSQPFLQWCVMISQIPAAVASGRLRDAEERTAQVPDFRIPDAATLHRASLAAILYEQGRLGELEATLRQTVEQLPRVPLFQGLLALAYVDLDRPADARAALRSLGKDLGHLVFDYFAAPTAAVLATVCFETRDAEGAASLVPVIAPHTDQVASHPGVWFGSFSHHLGLLATTLGHLSEAAALFATAAATHERIGAPAWLARTRLEWARVLLTRRQPGDSEQAGKLAGSALATARELSLVNVERRAAEILYSE